MLSVTVHHEHPGLPIGTVGCCRCGCFRLVGQEWPKLPYLPVSLPVPAEAVMTTIRDLTGDLAAPVAAVRLTQCRPAS